MENKYTEVADTIRIDAQWGFRANPPTFNADESNPNDSSIDYSEGTNNTTLKYDGKEYKLINVQLAQATHKEWIIPSNRRESNKEDFIITLEAGPADVTQHKYIVIIVPILRSGATEPNYLKALKEGAEGEAGPFHLGDLVPKIGLYAVYSTCLRGREFVDIFVSTAGLEVSGTLMQNIANRFETFEAKSETRVFPLVRFPFQDRFEGGVRFLGTDFNQFVSSTDKLFQISEKVQTQRVDGVNAYKCMQLDPEKDIRDGQLVVDTTTGELLSNVLQAREDVKAAATATVAASEEGGMPPGRLERYLSSALGIFLTIIACLIGILALFSIFRPAAAAAAVPTRFGVATGVPVAAAPVAPTFWGRIGNWIQSGMLYVLMAVIFGFVGFIVGALLS